MSIRNSIQNFLRFTSSSAIKALVIPKMGQPSRWSFNSSEWDPTREQLLQISTIIQPEEKARIARFVFKRDAKSSVIGRLLIRKLINTKTGISNNLIKLGRDTKNKPILISLNGNTDSSDTKVSAQYDNASESDSTDHLNFNVSHQGNFVVLAADPRASQIGIDVMNIEKPGRVAANVDEYFRLMNRQFTANEWRQIRSDPGTSDLQQMANFTRFWCLKESYVKAVGVGIVIDLRTVDFETQSGLIPDRVITNTTVKVNGISEPEWHFEERFLDNLHIVSVAKELKEFNKDGDIPEFELVSLEFLLDMDSQGEEDHEWVQQFMVKK